MKINLRNFPEEGRHYEGEDPASILDVEDSNLRFDAPVSYDVNVVVSGNSLVATGRVWTRVGITCVRCLCETVTEANIRNFVGHQEITPKQDFVDLTENLREDILLTLPQNPLCKKDCRGLCPVCGKNLNEANCSCAKKAATAKAAGGSSTGTPWSALDRIKIVRK